MRNLILLAVLALSSAVIAASSCWMKPDTQALWFVKGVEGGIAPHTPPLCMIVVGSRILVRRHDSQDHYFEGHLEDFAGLEKELQEMGLFSLTPDPMPGMEDFYNQGICVHFHHGSRCWRNEPPTGCTRCAPTSQPSSAEVATFKKVAERLEQLAARADQPCSASEYHQAFNNMIQPRQVVPTPAR